MGKFLVIGPKGGFYTQNIEGEVIDQADINSLLADKIANLQVTKVNFPVGCGQFYPLAVFYDGTGKGHKNIKAEEALASVLNGAPLYGYVGLAGFNQNNFLPLEESIVSGFAGLLGKEIEDSNSDESVQKIKIQRNNLGYALTALKIKEVSPICNSVSILDTCLPGFDNNEVMWGGEIETIDVMGTPLEKEITPLEKYPMGYDLVRLTLPVVLDLAKKKASGQEMPYSFLQTEMWNRVNMVLNKKIWALQEDGSPLLKITFDDRVGSVANFKLWLQDENVNYNNLSSTVTLTPITNPHSLSGVSNSFAIYTDWYNLVCGLWPTIHNFCSYYRLGIKGMKAILLLYKSLHSLACYSGEDGAYSWLSFGDYFGSAPCSKRFISECEHLLQYFQAGKDGVW